MYARRILIANNALVHVTFRCHNRQFFLEPSLIKERLLLLLATYKDRYRIKIFDFSIMDNHVHLFLTAATAECLGDFMRTVNSQLARHINSQFKRDSQAIRDRYKSPQVSTFAYAYKLIQYMAAGVVPLGSRVGENKIIIQEGINGFLADTPAEWLAKLELLCRDQLLRATIGARAREKALKEYDISCSANAMHEIFKEVLAKREGPAPK